MALPATTVWEVRTTGADTNGGGFVAGGSGTDWSQQDSPQYSVTDAVTAGTTTITSLTANFGTDVVDNLLYIAGGTGSITGGWYHIVSRTNATTIVVDRSTGLTAGTGATLKIGGALGSPGQLGAVEVAGNTAWFKSGTYTITTTTPNVSGGVLKDVVGGIDGGSPLRWEGYNVTRGDRGTTRPIFKLQNSLTTSAINIIEYEGAAKKYTLLDSINVDAGTGNTNASGIVLTTNSQYVTRCKVSNTTVYGIKVTDQYEFVTDVEVTGFSGTAGIWAGTSADSTTNVVRAVVHDGSAPGIDIACNGADLLVYNITNGGTGSHPGAGIVARVFAKIVNATSYNCVDGVFIEGLGGGTYILGILFTNVLCYGNSNLGWHTEENEGIIRVRLINCAGGGNTSGNYDSGITSVNLENFVALTADPFVNGAGADFRLNIAAGGGMALRGHGAGVPSSVRDIGSVQTVSEAGVVQSLALSN